MTRSYWIRLACFCVMGSMQLKNGVGMAWAFELVCLKDVPLVCSLITMFDVSTLMWVNLYIIFISREWSYILTAYCVIGIVSWIVIYLVAPESPKWMMIGGRPKECKDAL
jgi:hypothetical protein